MKKKKKVKTCAEVWSLNCCIMVHWRWWKKTTTGYNKQFLPFFFFWVKAQNTKLSCSITMPWDTLTKRADRLKHNQIFSICNILHPYTGVVSSLSPCFFLKMTLNYSSYSFLYSRLKLTFFFLSLSNVLECK